MGPLGLPGENTEKIKSNNEKFGSIERFVLSIAFQSDSNLRCVRIVFLIFILDGQVLREAFGLERAAAVPGGDRWDIRQKPRLLIISRKNTRMFLNERAMVEMATSLGFDVRVGEPDVNTDIGQFARLVNSADVMLGVHGAGLTNMVFLPAGAVLIQVCIYLHLSASFIHSFIHS